MTASLIANLDPSALARQGATDAKRYSDEQLLGQISECAERIGKSPTMSEFEADEATTAHPQTIIARFGSWNEAKRKAGLRPRRFATDADLLAPLKTLGKSLGRVPTADDITASTDPNLPSVATYRGRFGSLSRALQQAGFDVAVTADEKLAAAVEQGVALTERLGHLPTMTEWAALREAGENLVSEWRIYRLCQNEHASAWAAFRLLISQSVQGQAAAA
jgi:hypothetical protein